MPGFLLDTNIVSETARQRPSATLARWLSSQQDDTLHISALTVAEIRRGILEKEDGKRRRALEAWFLGPEGPQGLFARRILPFDERSALEWARIMSDGTRAGRPRNATDMIIAATAVAHRLIVATANERHFRDIGLPWFNPLADSG